MKLKNGFTLVELLVVITILAILMVMAIGIINPRKIADQGYDAIRKKDLARIKVAFEDYATDHNGCYPRGYTSGGQDFDTAACDSNFFAPWLDIWPCDPGGQNLHYKVMFDQTDPNCAHWFRVYTELRNHSDDDIPVGWYSGVNFLLGDGTIDSSNYNYGVSSTNVNWYSLSINPLCKYHEDNHAEDLCVVRRPNGECAGQTDDLNRPSCVGGNCFVTPDGVCYPVCQVPCCGYGCLE